MTAKKNWVAKTVRQLDALLAEVNSEVRAMRDSGDYTSDEARATLRRLRALHRLVELDRALVRCTLLDKRNRAAKMRESRLIESRTRALKVYLHACGETYDERGWREQVYRLEPRLKEVGF